MAEAQGLAFNDAATALARAFWPGPLTLVLPGGSGRLPDLLRGPEGGIAVRWTSHRGMARLVQALEEPVTSTSANLPGQPPAPGAEALTRDFGDAVAAGTLVVLDGGVLGNSPPSTVVDCTQPAPRLIREGALTLAELRRAAGRLAPEAPDPRSRRRNASCWCAPATSAAAPSRRRCSSARSWSAAARGSPCRRPARVRGTARPSPRGPTWSGSSAGSISPATARAS